MNVHPILGYVLIYVDDFLIAAPASIMNTVIGAIQKVWKTSDPKYVHPKIPSSAEFLGITLRSVPTGGLTLDQSIYAEKLLKAYTMDKASPSMTPGDPEPAFSTAAPASKTAPTNKNEEEEITEKEGSTTQALRLTGALLWLTTRTRIDLALVAHKSAKNALNSPKLAMAVGKRGLRYLRGTHDYALFYSARGDGDTTGPGPTSKEALDIYSDASHMADWEKSQLGVDCELNAAPVAWRTTHATLAAGSTCESELQAAVLGAQMGVGLVTLLEDLGVYTTLWQGVDNQAALSVLADTSSWRTRHLAIRSAVLRDLIRDGIMECQHVRSADHKADGLTKFLKPDPHRQALVQWRLQPLGTLNPKGSA